LGLIEVKEMKKLMRDNVLVIGKATED